MNLSADLLRPIPPHFVSRVDFPPKQRTPPRLSLFPPHALNSLDNPVNQPCSPGEERRRGAHIIAASQKGEEHKRRNQPGCHFETESPRPFALLLVLDFWQMNLVRGVKDLGRVDTAVWIQKGGGSVVRRGPGATLVVRIRLVFSVYLFSIWRGASALLFF